LASRRGADNVLVEANYSINPRRDQETTMQKTAKILSLCAALAAMAATVSSADARGRGGHGVRAAGLHIGVGHRFHGHRFHRHRLVRVGYAVPYAAYDYCRWYRTSYGPVKRCFYY
jgi:hypothetical protein